MKDSTKRKLWHRTTGLLVPAWLFLGLVAAVLTRSTAYGPWLMVHLLLLGGVSTAILVWSQYFADSLLKNTAAGGRVSLGVRLSVHTVGAATVMTGIVYGWWIVTLIGGILVGGSALLHAGLMIGQLRGALPARFSRLVRYYVASAGALVAGVTFGIMMAHPKSSILNTAGEYYERLYIGHLALNLLGWIGLTVIGTVALLWPTVLHSPVVQKTAAASRGTLPILVGGLTVISVGSLVDSRFVAAAGVLLYLGGLMRVLVELVGHARRLPVISYAGWSLGAAVSWFALCTAAFGVAIAVAPSWADAAAGVEALVPYFALGFAGQIVIGALSYLIAAVLPGGPLTKTRIFAELDRGGLFRAAVVNGGLLLTLLPLPGTAVTLVMGVVLVTLASFLVFMVRALRESRRMIAALIGARPPAGAGPGLLPVGGLPVTGNPAPALARPSPSLSSAAMPASPSPSATAVPASRASDRPAAAGPGAGAPAATSPTPSRRGLVAAAATLALALAIGVGMNSSAMTLAGTGGALVGTGHTTTVDVTMIDTTFSPDSIDVPVGDTLIITVINDDGMLHDLVLESGGDSGPVEPGTTATIDAGVMTADIDGWCSIGGHRLLGMVLTINVIGAAAGAGDAAATDDGTATDQGAMSDTTGESGDSGESGESGESGATGSAAADLTPGALPGDDFVARDAALAPAPSATVHKLTMTVTDEELEVAPGVTQTLWTYNGGATGPTLRGKVGDAFDVTFANEGTISHSIDFHAGALAPDKPMRSINPGESLAYRFTATRSGIWMYHCGTMPMTSHIANGMFGAVIIDPAGLSAVDREYALVQSEYYLGVQGGEVDAAKAQAGTPDLVVFNGYSDQYVADPLIARVGETVRVWVLDAGPNTSSSFHVVGGQFHTVFAEGEYLLQNGGSTGTGGAQTLALSPAQGGFVELTFTEAGTYSFVSHIMADAEKGAHGVFVVTDDES